MKTRKAFDKVFGENQTPKTPPQDIGAEQAIIGAIMLDSPALNRVLEIIGADDFYSPAHQKIFSSALDLYNSNTPCDIVTVSNNMQEKGELDKIGGRAYLAGLIEDVSSIANVYHYARIVKRKSVLRNLISAAGEISEKSFNSGMDVDDILDEAQQAIFSISEFRTQRVLVPFGTVLKDTMGHIENLMDRKDSITGVPTGFTKIDELTAGMQKGDLIIVAARPSMGKTAFALDIARRVAYDYKIATAVFSLEMSKEQLAMRMLSADAKVDSQKIRKGFLPPADWQKLVDSAGNLYNAPLYVDDTPAITVLEMKSKARRLAADKGLGMIIVDYLQLMRGNSGRESREQEISEISRSLKALAKELNVPIIALSQLNRKVEDRVSRIPQLADLRESGAIEQDADVIMFIYRAEVYNKTKENYDPEQDPDRGMAKIIVEKQRNGPTGIVELAFLKEYTSFENLSVSGEYTPKIEMNKKIR